MAPRFEGPVPFPWPTERRTALYAGYALNGRRITPPKGDAVPPVETPPLAGSRGFRPTPNHPAFRVCDPRRASRPLAARVCGGDTRRAMSQENVEAMRRGDERWRASGEIRAHADLVWDVSRLGWPDRQLYHGPAGANQFNARGRMRGMAGSSRPRNTSTPGSASSSSSTSGGVRRPREFPSRCASLRCGRSGTDRRSGCRCTRTWTKPSKPWGVGVASARRDPRGARVRVAALQSPNPPLRSYPDRHQVKAGCGCRTRCTSRTARVRRPARRAARVRP